MDDIFIQLAIILGIASFLGFVTVRLKLPLIIAYLVGGLVIATAAFFDVHTSKALSFLPDIGIAFVLFLVGMELDLREIRNLGKPIISAGLLQIFITTILGSILAKNFGFGTAESWYLGVGLAFSSTIVVVKILLDKKNLTSLYGKLSLGILLLEDLVAVLILLALTVSPSIFGLGYSQVFPLWTFIVKVILLFSIALLLNHFLLANIFKAVSRSSELLFLTALAWCFIYVSFAILLGFSVVIGAFLGGVALASSPYHFQIQGKIKPLRDFFVALFFVYLGTQVNFADLSKVYPLILIFTAYALIVKPLIFLLIMGGFGFKKHTMFQVAINMTQISEFSLIVILVGMKVGLATQSALTVIALTAVLTMVISSLMITSANKIYKELQSLVSFFERKNVKSGMEKSDGEELEDHIIIIGGHRIGGEIIKYFKKEKIPHLVLDFNPHQVEELTKQGVNVVYGDIGDPEIADSIHLSSAKMVISTAADVDDNFLLLEQIKSKKLLIPVIARAESIEDAKILYHKGADFVIIPDIMAGDLLMERLKDHLNDDYFKGRARIEIEKLSKKTFAWE